MSISRDIISKRRERVIASYKEAELINYELFYNGDDRGTAEYIFPNQKEDANAIVDKFYKDNRRVISIQKKTKVGADGLMIEIAKLLTTHIDDNFIVNIDSVRILTGMSNASWEKDMIDKAPNCFKDKIFHHGKLSRADLMSITNGLFIIDEIDTGDKPDNVLPDLLHEAGILDVEHMKTHNNRFVLISATMIKELYDLYRWGPLHALHKMIIPPSYIGHKDFLDKGIIKEFYSLENVEDAERWIQEDIIDNYGDDYRVHIVRVDTKTVHIVQNACIRKGVTFRNHTSIDRLSEIEIKEFFKEPLSRHIVLGVKGFFRRANLIPNKWKLRIGATHERWTRIIDYSVQVQGLPGRMSGYWRDIIESGHKTGPHRTSLKAIEEYEKIYEDPFGKNSYQTAGFKKTKGTVCAEPTMLSPMYIKNLDAIQLPGETLNDEFERGYRVFDTHEENDNYAKTVGAKRTTVYDTNDEGFKLCSTTHKKVHSLAEIETFISKSTTGSNMAKKIADIKVGEYDCRRYVCYKDISNKSSECFVTNWIKRIKAASHV
jgi:hypothetical protein